MFDKNENALDNRFEKLLEVEVLLKKIENSDLSDGSLQKLKCAVKDLIVIHSNGTIKPALSFSKVLKAAGENSNVNRFVALLVLRILNVSGLLQNTTDDKDIEQCVAQLVENALPDFEKTFKFSEKKQTFEKIRQMEQVHAIIMDNLLFMKNIPHAMTDIVRTKESAFKAINNKHVKTYLRSYDYNKMQSQIMLLYKRAEVLVETKDDQFGILLNELKGLVTEYMEYSEKFQSILLKDYYGPFLNVFNEALKKLDKDSIRILDCSLKPIKSGNYKAEKKYPLHEIEREIKVMIPLINSGPGIAYDVNAVILYDTEFILVDSELSLGDIRTGEFPFTLNVLIVEPVEEILFDVELSWKIMGQLEPKSISFKCNIQSQDPSIDWKSMEYIEPYSTEIAEGDEFVGRKKKVAVLAKRLLKSRMQSSYITGQKRVGKTSLSLAAIQDLQTVDKDHDIETKYIEWGDVAHSDPEKSVEALGGEIANFLMSFLPEDDKTNNPSFKGSIAPLNNIAITLRDKLPHKKFVIILDEFDEIPIEMYRYGPLAEAFFSNLRTLSSKSNMAFMLVGGEKMPFIMSSQGDQLNKFVGEQLDYFSIKDEYDDYMELVTKPSDGMITWSDGTLEYLFHITNGHPFYTKLICSEIFNSAVRNRDADVSVRDVKQTVENIVCQLNVNQFAHHWKDGISKNENEESISLDRCRVLVVIGRVMRRHKKLTFDNMVKNINSRKLGELQLSTILNDFCRRTILKEENGLYRFVVPLFGMWLEQTGVDRLIADRLGDELSASQEIEEEKARVSSSEIIELVNNWSAYRGREITAENVRAWLEQTSSFKDQRLLFIALKNLRFVSEAEIRDKLKLAHNKVRKLTPTIVTTTKRQKRNDIIVTYVDGEAKSGQYYASRYAEENKISTSCVINPLDFSKRSKAYEDSNNITVNGIVIVDDIVATGDSLSKAVQLFVQENHSFIEERSIKLVVVALYGTAKGIKKVDKVIGALDSIEPELQIMEPLEDRHYAFANEPGIWPSIDDFHRAKGLCLELGAKIYNKNPLGFGNLGLLIVFPTTCPNNTLPIIHSSSKGSSPWIPLFPRPVN